MAWDDAPPTIEELKKKMPAAVATVAWDAEPPKPEELSGGPSVMSKLGEFAGNVGRNALDILNPLNIAKQAGATIMETLHDIPIDVAKSSVGVVKAGAKAIAGKSGLEDVVKSVTESPIVKRTRAMTEPIAKNPGKFAFERPLDAASLLLAPIAPFLSEASAARLPGAVERISGKPGLIQRATAKTISVGLGAPEDAILERMQNPTGVKTAFTHSELADQMVNSVKNLGETVSELSGEARKNLRSSPFIQDGAIPKAKIAEAVKAARRDLGGVFSQESQAASKALKNVQGLFKKLRNTVSEQQVRDLVDQLDSDIDWSNPAASRTNEALVNARTRLDAMLKKQNPYYAEGMKPTAEATRVMTDMQKKFGIGRKVGEGFHLTDQTVGKIKSALKENRMETQSLLERYKKITGEDIESKIRGANISAAFEGSNTNGSRRAVIGGGVATVGGYMLGLPPQITGPLGIIAGGFADIYGRRMAGALADTLARAPEMRRYIPVLETAARNGPKMLAAAHARLIEQDPDYTTAMTGAITRKISANSGGKR